MTIETAPAAPAMTVADMANRIVREDVLLCVSVLVSDLRNVIAHLDLSAARDLSFSDEELLQLSYRAPDADDYAESDEAFVSTGGKRQRAYDVESGDDGYRWTECEAIVIDGEPAEKGEWFETPLEAWQECFETNNLDAPDGGEIYEHWAVSSFLADALVKHGETVVRDFAGMTVWGRPTTGQSITMDHVIQEIARDILAA